MAQVSQATDTTLNRQVAFRPPLAARPDQPKGQGMRKLLRSGTVIAIAFLLPASSQTRAPQAAQRQGTIPLTSDQVEEGRVVYDANCASCHGPSLSDGVAGSLTGRAFQTRWTGQSPVGLRDYLRQQMPPGQPGSLTDEEYRNLVALLLHENGYAPGEAVFRTDDEMVASMRMQFSGVNTSSGGPLAWDVTLPSWPTTPDPTQDFMPVTDEMLRNPAPGDWLTWRRTPDGLGFSPLAQITEANVSDLQLVWAHALAPGPNASTPLVHDGVLFVASVGSTVDALNASTGELLWTYAPEAGGGTGAQRIMSLYGDNLYLLVPGGGVGALDARTGKLVWEAALPARPSGGPLVVGGTVFQGVGSLPGARGSVQALDADVGTALWRWFAIPKTGEPGGNSWGGMPDDQRTGAAVWTTAYFDSELNLVYVGTGNTYDTAWLAERPEYPGQHDALHTNSTVALHPETGEMAWAFQHQAGDPFDLDWAFERMIVPLSINGRTTKAVVTMGKPGVLDAVDAATGRYLFSMDAGVQNFITQIDPTTGAKTIDRSLVPVPGEEKIWTVCPNWLGVKSWLPGAINPNTKVAFMALNESCMDLTPARGPAMLSSGVTPYTRPVPDSDGRYGRVQAFDLQNRQVLWTERQHAPMTSAVLATAGGVVFAGALDQTFSAYDDQTGEKLWSTRLSDVPSSAPITYMVDGEQYVAVVVGFGSPLSMGFTQLVPDILTPVRPSAAIYVFAVP